MARIQLEQQGTWAEEVCNCFKIMNKGIVSVDINIHTF